MKRREFVTLLGSAAAAWPLAARAQQSEKIWRVGVLEATTAERNATNLLSLKQALLDLGYVEGRNLAIEYRSADGRAEHFEELAAELVPTSSLHEALPRSWQPRRQAGPFPSL
jgi:putative tryptophan/tyrosine transport system substrate-binding protein